MPDRPADPHVQLNDRNNPQLGRVQDFPPPLPHSRADAEAQQAIADLRREMANQREVNRALTVRMAALEQLVGAHGDGHNERHDDLIEAVSSLRRRVENLEIAVGAPALTLEYPTIHDRIGSLEQGGGRAENLERRDSERITAIARRVTDLEEAFTAPTPCNCERSRPAIVPDERVRGFGELAEHSAEMRATALSVSDAVKAAMAQDAEERHAALDRGASGGGPSPKLTAQDDTEEWRDVGDGFRHNLLRTIQSELSARLVYGAETHGPVFKGDPLAHLIEELLDALVYAAVCGQKISALEEAQEG